MRCDVLLDGSGGRRRRRIQKRKKKKETKLTRMGSDMAGALHNVYMLYNKQHTDDRTLARICGKHITIGVALRCVAILF